MASIAPASSRFSHQRWQGRPELKHPRQAATPRSTVGVRASAAPGGNAGRANSQTSSGASEAGNLFDREYELDELEKLCSGLPQGISVILGPRNCGKTKVLKAFVKRRGLEGTRSYIDCRKTPMRTPQDMAASLSRLPLPTFGDLLPRNAIIKALRTRFPGLLRRLLERASVTSELGLYSFTTNALADYFWGKPVEPTSLQSVLDAYDALLEAWEKAREEGMLKATGTPVLVIDEANVIMDWSGKYPEDLKTLLAFLVSNTKQDQRAHVLLATSDSAFINWVDQNVGGEFYQAYAIGEFTEGEARGFLLSRLQVLESIPPGVLENAATSYVRFGSWQEAVSHVLRSIKSNVNRGFNPLGNVGFEGEDFRTAVNTILASKYLAVDVEVLQQKIKPSAFNALIAANLLGIRCSPKWARDVDAEAFSPGNGTAMVVTAPNSAHLAVWRQRAPAALQRPWLKGISSQRPRGEV
eukprot:jgi/Chlat1/1516/Chrsp12S02034